MDTDNAISPRLLAGKLVYIVDSNLDACELLSVAFRLEGFQTSFFVSSVPFFAACLRRMPDVIVLSLGIGDEGGIAVLRRIKNELAGIPVIALASDGSVDAAVLAMKYGAADVVSQPCDTEHLMQIVRDCIRKDIHIGAMRGGVRAVEVRGFSKLTGRERQVLNLLVNGFSNKAMGRELQISPRTVEVHRGRVMDKLGAKNTADLLRIVLTS